MRLPILLLKSSSISPNAGRDSGSADGHRHRGLAKAACSCSNAWMAPCRSAPSLPFPRPIRRRCCGCQPHQVGELAQPGAALYGIQHTHDGRIILFGGGYPLCVGRRALWARSGSAAAPSSRTCRCAQRRPSSSCRTYSVGLEMKGLRAAHHAIEFVASQVVVKDSLTRVLAGSSAGDLRRYGRSPDRRRISGAGVSAFGT